jgi:hypothetical protein
MCPDYTKGAVRKNRISVKSVKSVVHFIFMKHEELKATPAWRWRCFSTSRNQNWHGSGWCAAKRSEGQEKDHGFHGLHGWRRKETRTGFGGGIPLVMSRNEFVEESREEEG